MRLDDVRGFVFDVDGTLVRRFPDGVHPLPGAVEVLEAIRASGRPLAIFSNGSHMPPAQFARDLRADGLPVSDEEMVTPVRSAFAALRNEIVPWAVTRHSSLHVVDRTTALVREVKCRVFERAKMSFGAIESVGGITFGGSVGGGCTTGGGVGVGGWADPPQESLPGHFLVTLTFGLLPLQVMCTSTEAALFE